jgi:hypothetical protein
MPSNTKYQMIDNYIYLYHTDTLIIVPSYSASSINDTISVQFTSTQPLSRSAPIYSYTGSGPRSLQVSFDLHRDMMEQINLQNTKTVLKNKLDGDYVDRMIKEVQAAALPSYASAQKMVNPPVVALRLGDEIFIKGVVSGGVSVSYEPPLLAPKYEGGPSKYATVKIGFTINEIDPYDAQDVMKYGSFRGLSTSLERRIYGNTGTIIPKIVSARETGLYRTQ